MPELLLQFAYDTGIFQLMNTRWGWPIAESLHFIGLCLLIGAVGFFDLRLLGLGKQIPIASLHKLVPWGIGGYVLNVTTGFLFLVSAPRQYVYNPAFQTKMLFMALAGLNMVFFYLTTSKAIKADQPARSALNRAVFFGAISLGCWIVVITCGRLITFFRPPYHWCFWC